MLFHQQLKNKLQNKEQLLIVLNQLKANGKKVVFTNGCFDILHRGHVEYLAKARDLGDFLVLGLNTDESVKRLGKAPNRPINNEQARASVLAGLTFIDAVVLFNEDTPLELIKFLMPTILVKGNDYKIENIVGAKEVIANGGKVETIEFVEGYSTTNLIKKILG